MEGLDRETIDAHRLTIIASDGGTPARSCSLFVNIVVEDANDNAPQFDSPAYEFRIFENLTAGSSVGRVSAADRDVGRNGRLSYSMSTASHRKYGHVFGVVESTGEVFTRRGGVLDAETIPAYVIWLTAVDDGVGPLTSRVKVTVILIDVNDNPPKIILRTLTEHHHPATISEVAPPGTFVAHLNVADDDNGDNGRVKCHVGVIDVVEDAVEARFDLRAMTSSGMYSLMTTGELDRERTATYNLSIVCVDLGQPPLSSEVRLIIAVSDYNDCPPRFSQKTYRAKVIDGWFDDIPVTTVLATDEDEGDNGKVSYRLVGSNEFNKLFCVHAISGAVTLQTPLDRSLTPELRLVVLAEDMGEHRLTGTSEIIITVSDVRDECPRFVRQLFVFIAFENQAPDTEIGRVQVYQGAAVADRHNWFRFELDDGEMEAECFRMDHATGSIRTLRRLDRELRSTYEFKVYVRRRSDDVLAVQEGTGDVFPVLPGYDNVLAEPREFNDVVLAPRNLGDVETFPAARCGTAKVVVHVADINDNKPEITWPTYDGSIVYVTDRMSAGDIVLQILSTDRDVGRNARMSYSALDGSCGDVFVVDADNGKVTVGQRPNVISCTLHATVCDRGAPKLCATCRVHIVVNVTADRYNDIIYVDLDVVGMKVITLACIIFAGCTVLMVCVVCRRRLQLDDTLLTRSTQLEIGI